MARSDLRFNCLSIFLSCARKKGSGKNVLRAVLKLSTFVRSRACSIDYR